MRNFLLKKTQKTLDMITSKDLGKLHLFLILSSYLTLLQLEDLTKTIENPNRLTSDQHWRPT